MMKQRGHDFADSINLEGVAFVFVPGAKPWQVLHSGEALDLDLVSEAVKGRVLCMTYDPWSASIWLVVTVKSTIT